MAANPRVPPGHTGLPLVGDKSVEFYRNPLQFVERRMKQHDSRVFLSRLLNKPTVFVASNAGVYSLLHECSAEVELGYKALMEQVYGDNIIFTNGDEAYHLRSLLGKILMTDDFSQNFQRLCSRLTSKHLRKLKSGQAVEVYDFFKRLATEICLSSFLDINFETSEELANTIVGLTTTHWHGIISVPLSLKLPMLNQSSYGKALRAKEQLLHIIQDKLSQSQDSFGHRLQAETSPKSGHHSPPPPPQTTPNHVLLLTSALVPKAIASILTSFVLSTANRSALIASMKSNPSDIESVLLEVQRLWPPFIGGRRVAKQDFCLHNYHIRKDQAIVYMTHHAHRDSSVFHDPDEFVPERWKTRNKEDKDRLFAFGGGSRDCLGHHLVNHIFKEVCGSLLQEYTWSIPEGQQLNYKWLPVSRPQSHTLVTFTRDKTQDAE